MPENKGSSIRCKSPSKSDRQTAAAAGESGRGIRHTKTKKKHDSKQGQHTLPRSQQPAKACFGVKKLPTNMAIEVVPSRRSRNSSKSPVRAVSHNLAAIRIRSKSNPYPRAKNATADHASTRTRPTTGCSRKSPSTSKSRATTSLPDRTQKSCLGSEDTNRSTKKKKKQNLLKAIKPSNVESEKTRFMARLHDYDPRFVYISPPSEDDLERFAKPSKKLLNQAINIMHITLKRYGCYEKFQEATGGQLISRREFTNMFKEYVAMERVENKVLLYIGEEIVSRALMTRSKGKPCLNVRVSTLREKWAPGLLRHELGTHYLRNANNKHQPWYNARGRDSHNLMPANPTEEGLASLHSVLCRDEPYLWRAALLYYTTYKASLMSFSNLFRDLERFVLDPVTRWDYCVRAKRGLVDTSEPGCFSKDQVYLTGIFEILRYRHRIDFHNLVRLGKVARQDVERLKPQAVLDPKIVKIPFFMLDLQAYKAKLHYIMSKNGITDVELVRLYPDVDGEVWGSER